MNDEQIAELIDASMTEIRFRMDEIIYKYAPNIRTADRLAMANELLAVEPF